MFRSLFRSLFRYLSVCLLNFLFLKENSKRGKPDTWALWFALRTLLFVVVECVNEVKRSDRLCGKKNALRENLCFVLLFDWFKKKKKKKRKENKNQKQKKVMETKLKVGFIHLR